MLCQTLTRSEESYDYKIDKYIRVLRDAWVTNFGTLLRLPKGALRELGLPLALTLELERLQECTNNVANVHYIHFQEVCESPHNVAYNLRAKVRTKGTRLS